MIQAFLRGVTNALVPPPVPRSRLYLLGDPRDMAIPKRLVRRLMGCRWPRTCPTCRTCTRQWWVNKVAKVWFCGACQHTYQHGKIVESRRDRAKRKRAELGERLLRNAGIR